MYFFYSAPTPWRLQVESVVEPVVEPMVEPIVEPVHRLWVKYEERLQKKMVDFFGVLAANFTLSRTVVYKRVYFPE